MTAYTGTNLDSAPRFQQGYEFTAVGTYALTGALVNADTITWTNILPDSKVTIIEASVVAPELDTNATPTGTIKVGNSDDDDGYIKATGIAATLDNSLAESLNLPGDGDLVHNTAGVTNRSVVLTVASAVATGATSGTIRLMIRYRCGTV